MPTMSCRWRASSISAWPNGAGFVRCPSAAIEAIMAEVVSRGFAAAGEVLAMVGFMAGVLLPGLAARAATRVHPRA